MIYYLERLGWELFSRGTSHRVYKHPLVPVAVNIQPRRDGKAKSYQVAQVRDALALYTGDDKEEWLRGQSLRQPNDECSVAGIADTGCAADGDTPEEALRNLRELKAVWMRAVAENGYVVPPPRRGVEAQVRRLAAA